eukprot:7179657-Pyramimonas_sp.AAC.2
MYELRESRESHTVPPNEAGGWVSENVAEPRVGHDPLSRALWRCLYAFDWFANVLLHAMHVFARVTVEHRLCALCQRRI